MQANNSELRCAHCKRKLGVASGHYSITIKCPRCKGATNWKAESLNNRAPSSAFLEGNSNVSTNNQMDGR